MKIVAFDGADGTGKSTQAEILTNRLRADGKRATLIRPVFLLFDPWRIRDGGVVSAAVSPRMQRLGRTDRGLRPNGARPSLRSLLGYVYALATYAYIRLAFRRDDYVVCDRYLYQYLFDVFGPSAASVAKVFPRPDRLFWIDASIDLLRARSEKPFDEAQVRYYEQVLRFYQDLAGPLQFIRIDAADDVQSIHERALHELPPPRGVDT
jgi:thymidylate kinase